MKQQKSNEGRLSTNKQNFERSTETISSGNMMADSSFNASTTKMLMPHELGASNNVGTSSLVGQHSIHGTSFYHPTGGNTTISTGFNGFHSSFPNYSHNLNGIGTIAANSATSSFSNLVHQQPITLSNNHSITTVTAISSTMPPPLIPYQTTTQQQQQTLFYTSSSSSSTTNHVSNATNEIVNQQKKTSEKAINNKNNIESVEEQQIPVATSNELTTTEDNVDLGEMNQEQDEPEIDIVISNVVCAFSVRCHLSLKEIALHGYNVEYKRENGMVTMKLRKPYTTASIWSSGKVTCTGATSEDQARIAARRTARMLQKLNFRVRFHNYRVVNVLGTCKMPWAIKIVQFSEKYKKEASYEPELHPGVTYNLKNPTATLKIFSTGSMTVTARSVADVQAAIEHIYPLVYEFKKPRVVDIVEEDLIAELVETDVEGDDELEDAVDPLEDSPPPNKKQKLRDISHLSKRYKGPSANQRPKRPLGKMNDPKQDLIYVSDGEIDGDDFE